MSKYKATVEINLWQEITPDGYFVIEAGPPDGFEDISEFVSETVSTVGAIQFELEAENEDAASEGIAQAMEFVRFTNYGSTDSDWIIDDWSIESIELIEEPMTLTRAMEILREFLAIANHSAADTRAVAVTLTPDVYKAMVFVMAYLVEQRVAVVPVVVHNA